MFRECALPIHRKFSVIEMQIEICCRAPLRKQISVVRVSSAFISYIYRTRRSCSRIIKKLHRNIHRVNHERGESERLNYSVKTVCNIDTYFKTKLNLTLLFSAQRLDSHCSLQRWPHFSSTYTLVVTRSFSLSLSPSMLYYFTIIVKCHPYTRAMRTWPTINNKFLPRSTNTHSNWKILKTIKLHW